ncbi:hypothetical protein M9Y10_032137 [Tritrichomonas musculus]|uniref:Surface antigen BspA-like n=1 Tax=Tritrichomonas musculus TaxID=1915356 RepID=A0ABR2GZZ1_9EUKA
MLFPLILIFAIIRLVLAEEADYIYGCYSTPDDCPSVNSVEIKNAYSWPHYCDCNARDYQVVFKISETTTFKIPSQFFANSKISRISIPKNCQEIEGGAFFGSTIQAFSFETDAAPTLSEGAFSSVTFTGSLSLPKSNSGSSMIGSYVFLSSVLNSITLPDDLSSINSFAFFKATFKGDLTLTKNLVSVEDSAFESATFEKTVNFQNKNTVIRQKAFKDATITGQLLLPTELKTLSPNTFENAEIKANLEIPTGVTNIPFEAFKDAKIRKDFALHDKITTVSTSAFENAKFDKAFTFHSKNTYIDQKAFKDATITGKFTLPSELKSIALNTFENTEINSDLKIPDDVETIPSNAFKGATINGDFTLPNKLRTISSNAFEKTKFKKLVKFSRERTEILKEAFIGAVFSETLELPSETSAKDDDQKSVSYSISDSAFKNAVFHNSITFPSKLQKIFANAFYKAEFTNDISFPTTLQTIGYRAFYSCIFSLTNSLEFGESIIEIGESAFQGSNIQSISFNQKAKLTTIGQYAFQGTFQMTVSTKSSTLYAETINNGAFQGAESIDFSSITSKHIEKNAFMDCYNLVVTNGILILPDGYIKEAAFLNCRKLNGPLTINEPDKESSEDEPPSFIDQYAFMNTGITHLNAPHLKYIQQKAFYNCVLLQGPSDEKYKELYVDTIYENAFDGDTLLNYNTIKSKSISQYAFRLCQKLQANIVILGTKDNTRESSVKPLGDHSFYSCDKLGNLSIDISHLNNYQNFVPPNQKVVISKYAFAKSGLTGPLTIPHIVEEIENYAFSDCPNINELKIIRQNQDTLIIKDGAFRNSNIGKDLVIPEFVIQVCDKSFANTAIETLTIDGTSYSYYDNNKNEYVSLKTEVEPNAFSDCTKLKTLTFGNGSISIDESSFRGSHITSLQMGNVETIPNNAFIGMSLLDKPVVIPDSVTSIGARAFSECYLIPSITISPSSKLTEIGVAAFYKCKTIESIVIPPLVQKIDNYAFYQCTNLKTISILSRVSDKEDPSTPGIIIENSLSIGDYAFYGCSLEFPFSLTSIGDFAFSQCAKLKGGLKIDINVDTIGKYAFRDCSGLDGKLQIVEHYSNNKNPHEITLSEGAFYGCSGLTGDLTIPIHCVLYTVRQETDEYGNQKDVYEYNNNVFKGCTKLNGQLYLPDSIERIPSGTFCNCQNLNIQLKDNLVYIGNQAFMNCAKLTGTLDLSNYDYSNNPIGSYAFSNCTGLNGQLIFKELSDEVFITIGEYAFYNCNGLTGELNCSSLMIIGHHAFAGCSGFTGPLKFSIYLLKVGEYAFADCTGFSGQLSFRSIMDNELSIEESAFQGCTGFKDGSLLITMDRSNSDKKPSSTYYLKIERNAFKDIKFKDIRYIGITQPDCDCDIGLPSRKGIHTSSNYEGKSFCGNPLHKSKLSGGAIAGIVIACIVVVAVIVFLIVFFILKNKKNKDQSEGEVEMNQDP